MARTPRKPKLTAQEKRLLRFPPTPTTWECNGSWFTTVYEGDAPKKVPVRCGMVIAGNKPACPICGAAKPKRPRLVWPRYELACLKAGIEPGSPWRESSTPVPPPRPQQQTRRKR